MRRSQRAREHIDELGRRSRQVAMFVAAASVPRTLQPSLLPRSAVDQGIVSGVALVANYAVANTIHDALQALGSLAARNDPRRRRTGAADATALALGIALQLAFPRREHERLGRGALRVAGWYTSWVGVAGLATVALQETLARIDEGTGNRYNLQALPVAIPAGAALSAAVEYSRRRGSAASRPHQDADERSSAIVRSVATGAAVAGVLTAVASAERAAAVVLEQTIARYFPEQRRFAPAIGHTLSLGSLAAAGYAGVRYLYHDAEVHARQVEQGFSRAPKSPLASGGPGSYVAFETLSQFPRRYVLTYLSQARIRKVMGEPPRAEPIRICVGIDSAATIDQRVQLALDEIERTAALDRSLLVLITPTGTGWIDPNMIESAEYYTRGDIASVALQYSERASLLSLDRVHVGHAQNSMLWAAINQRIMQRPPERRPRVVIFGESLGALTSQDVFIHQGTDGMLALGIDAGLWFGTPYVSGWKAEALDGRRADVDASLIGVFDRWEQLQALDPEQRDRLRFIMLTHDNDAVAKFGVDLLLRRPDWLAEHRTPALPAETRWYPITTFLQTAIDMKNAMHIIPGQFDRVGHDYRADTARFVLAAFRLEATAEQLARVEQALRRMEEVEAKWIAMQTKWSKVEG